MTIESILVSDNSECTTLTAGAEDTERNDSRKQQTTIDFKMVTFSLSGKDYAIDIMYVKEIAKAGNFTYVPNVFPFVVGVYNLRGEIIPILDMRVFFNVKSSRSGLSELEDLLILNVDDQIFGIIVDKIDKVVGVQKSSIQPPHPLFSDVNIKYISGVVESSRRLYILLDIERIFAKTSESSQLSAGNEDGFVRDGYGSAMNVQKHETVSAVNKNVSGSSVSGRESGGTSSAGKTAVSSEKLSSKNVSAAADETYTASFKELKSNEESEYMSFSSFEDDNNFHFIVESLKRYKNFEVSSINKKWIVRRFSEWKKIRKGAEIQLQNESDASEYLNGFWSSSTEDWWTESYAEAVFNILPENSARQIVVWNPGCGKGTETYCLACVLAKKYPSSSVRIYAQDIDLLNVSNAPLLNVPDSVASGWMSPFMSKDVAGNFTFSKSVRDSIMFEYHDCLHTNALPMTDIIFARDLLSFLEPEAISGVMSDFDEKMKGNGILFIGDNEELYNSSEFVEYTAGDVTAYKKQ